MLQVYNHAVNDVIQHIKDKYKDGEAKFFICKPSDGATIIERNIFPSATYKPVGNKCCC